MLSPRLLPAEHVVIPIDSVIDEPSLYAAIGEIVARRAHALARRGPRPEQVVQRLCARHVRHSAAVGGGFALPHAAVPALPRAMALYLRPARPLAMPTPDGEPITGVLSLLVPLPGLPGDHELLEAARSLLADCDVAAGLRQARNAASVCALLTH